MARQYFLAANLKPLLPPNREDIIAMELAIDPVEESRSGTEAPKDCKYLGYIAQTKTKEQDRKVLMVENSMYTVYCITINICIVKLIVIYIYLIVYLSVLAPWPQDSNAKRLLQYLVLGPVPRVQAFLMPRFSGERDSEIRVREAVQGGLDCVFYAIFKPYMPSSC